MELTRAQSVNRYIEEVYTDPCQWAVFPHGTTVLLAPPAVVPHTLVALRAREIPKCGIERGAYDGIKHLQDGACLVEFASKYNLPRGVQILGVFPSLGLISSRGAIEDRRCAPFVVNCNPGEIDEDSDDEDSDMSDDTCRCIVEEHARGFAA